MRCSMSKLHVTREGIIKAIKNMISQKCTCWLVELPATKVWKCEHVLRSASRRYIWLLDPPIFAPCCNLCGYGSNLLLLSVCPCKSVGYGMWYSSNIFCASAVCFAFENAEDASSCHMRYPPTTQVCVGGEVLLWGKCSTNFHIFSQWMPGGWCRVNQDQFFKGDDDVGPIRPGKEQSRIYETMSFMFYWRHLHA
jgi:hypothetical protein